MNDFSESGATVRLVSAWGVYLEGKRNGRSARSQDRDMRGRGSGDIRMIGLSGRDMAFGGDFGHRMSE